MLPRAGVDAGMPLSSTGRTSGGSSSPRRSGGSSLPRQSGGSSPPRKSPLVARSG
ncbi:unnamed protein product [Gulo gulo]|uniref:Uncharacterized protein n=1 Tax=Gulo gulo TaxID=48420 RepID=A0A9X9Q9I7_GULGU|nr:unnamed protein product [Gulo gulo]